MGLLRRSRRQGTPAQAVTQSAGRVLVVNALLGLGGYAVRQLVIRKLASGQAQGPDPAADQATPTTSLPDRMATSVATAVATRSVPGAVLVGGVMGLRALYRRGKARRAARLGQAPTDVG